MPFNSIQDQPCCSFSVGQWPQVSFNSIQDQRSGNVRASPIRIVRTFNSIQDQPRDTYASTVYRCPQPFNSIQDQLATIPNRTRSRSIPNFQFYPRSTLFLLFMGGPFRNYLFQFYPRSTRRVKRWARVPWHDPFNSIQDQLQEKVAKNVVETVTSLSILSKINWSQGITSSWRTSTLSILFKINLMFITFISFFQIILSILSKINRD